MGIVRHDGMGCKGTVTMTVRYFILGAVVLLSVVTWAQDDDDQLDLLDQLLVDMQDQTRSELVNRVRALEIENAELREYILSLRGEQSGTDAAELEVTLRNALKENAALREAIGILTKDGSGGGSAAVMETSAVKRGGEPVADPRESDPQTDPDETTFRVMKEWGRSPEATAAMPGSVASLKGMSVYVTPGTRDGDLENLARQLHADYADYDNVNIEIFDDPDAARDFADTGRASPRHRVGSISRHRKSGRDKILLFTDGSAREVLP
jgi:hypothetical protein